jgi:hypothetical protein
MQNTIFPETLCSSDATRPQQRTQTRLTTSISGREKAHKENWRIMALLGNAANLHLHGTGLNEQGGTRPSRALRKNQKITTTILSVEKKV